MNRRGFLQSILAAGVAPAVVGSGILMPVRKIIAPRLPEPEWVGIDFAGPYGVIYPLVDEIPEWMVVQAGERIALIREMVIFGALSRAPTQLALFETISPARA